MKYDLFGPTFKANPYPTYATMRADCPIYRRVAADGQTAVCFLTRYDDVATLLRDHKRFCKDVNNTLAAEQRDRQAPPSPLLGLLSNHMLNLDPPDHTRLRALVNKAFTGQVVTQLEARIQTIADGLLDRVHAKGSMDLIEDFAFPLPMIVIAELLGIPPRDRLRFRNWSTAFVTPSGNLQRSTKKLAKAGQVMADFTRYMRQVFAERRHEPRNDLISRLLQAEEKGFDVGTAAGAGPAVKRPAELGNVPAELPSPKRLRALPPPEQRSLLQAHPTLLPAAIEEMIRYDGPVERATMRFATEDVTLGDQTIPRGDAVSLVLAGADRDPAHFPNPDTFDITRENNRHLGFGLGIHYCLGSALARSEGQIAINTLLQRYPTLRLAAPPDQLKWRTIPILRGLHHLPVQWR